MSDALRSTEADRRSVDWYRAAFNLATVQTNIVAAGPNAKSEDRLDQAARSLTAVLGLAPDLAPAKAGEVEADAAFRVYWELVRRAAIVLAAGILKLYSRRRPTAAAAMAEAAVVALRAPGVETLSGRGLTPLRLLDAVKAEGPLDGRSHYNIACLYVQLGRGQDDDALQHLALGCLGSPSRTRWAPKDPTLLPLQKRRRVDWAKIFPPPKPPPQPKSDDG